MKITKNYLIKLLKEAFMDASEDRRQQILLGARTGNLTSGIQVLHDGTKELYSDDVGINDLSEDLAIAKRNLKKFSGKALNSNTYTKEHLWVNDLLIDLGQNIPGGVGGQPAAPNESILKSAAMAYLGNTTANLKGATSDHIFVRLAIKHLDVSGQNFAQNVLDMMQSSTFNFEDKADEWEIASLIIATYYITSKKFQHTDTASAGVDIVSLDNSYSFEIKSSDKGSPQASFSASLPSTTPLKFYVFITTNRCYLVESKLLRGYFLDLTSIGEESISELTAQGVDIESLKRFLMSDTYDDLLKGIKTGRDFQNLFLEDQNQDLKTIYNKIKNDIINQAPDMAGLILQMITGISAGQRIDAPKFGFGGLQIAFRIATKRQMDEISSNVEKIYDEISQGKNNFEKIVLVLEFLRGFNEDPEKEKVMRTNSDEKSFKNKFLELFNSLTDQEIAQLLVILQSSNEKSVGVLTLPANSKRDIINKFAELRSFITQAIPSLSYQKSDNQKNDINAFKSQLIKVIPELRPTSSKLSNEPYSGPNQSSPSISFESGPEDIIYETIIKELLKYTK
jgi:hypothetical protein